MRRARRPGRLVRGQSVRLGRNPSRRIVPGNQIHGVAGWKPEQCRCNSMHVPSSSASSILLYWVDNYKRWRACRGENAKGGQKRLSSQLPTLLVTRSQRTPRPASLLQLVALGHLLPVLPQF